MRCQPGTVQHLGRWIDQEAVRLDRECGAGLGKLGCQITEAIALLVADETDAVDARPGLRGRGDDRQRRHEIRHVRHVDVEPDEWTLRIPRHGHPVSAHRR